MAAVLTPAEYEYARSLEIHEIPNRLRCAKCNKPVFDAMKTDCCDTSICKPCSDKLSKACPACSHPITSEMTREDKRTRITLKAHIKGELQKRNNAQAADAMAVAEQSEAQAEKEDAHTADDTSITAADPHGEEPTNDDAAVDVHEQTDGETAHASNHQDVDLDDDDDRSSVEIITEIADEPPRPSSHHLQPQDQTQDAEDREQAENSAQTSFDNNSMHQINQQDQDHNFVNSNNNNNSMGGFGGMPDFNPMMAMQAAMSMQPFGMMPGMMGFPNMGMDPSMMFNGGFAGMNGMASMMNGNMMGGNFGMGDMNQFTSYNHQYANRYDRSHGHSFPSRNRGYGRGNYNQSYRGGRQQGFYQRGGRGRGGWNHNQYEGHNNHHQNQQQQNHSQGQDQPDEQGNEHTDEASGHENHPRDAVIPTSDAQPADGQDSETNHRSSQQPSAVSQPPGEYVEDEVDYDDDDPLDQQNDRTATDDSAAQLVNQHESSHEDSTRIPLPPVNAPTGPKAMRDGLPNSGRYSRPQVSSSGRDAGGEQAVAATAAAAAGAAAPRSSSMRPSSSRSYAAHEGGSHRRDHDYRQPGGGGSSRASSRSSAVRDTKRTKYSSRADDGHRYHERERYGREQSMDEDARHNRRDRKRGREYDDARAYREKKRSRSASPENDKSRRYRDRHDDRERTRGDRSREHHKSSNHHDRRHQDSADEAERYHRTARDHKSSRRERSYYENDNDHGHDRRAQNGSKPARPAILDHSEDLGFRIKGSKSRESQNQDSGDKNSSRRAPGAGTHRDPYAEERERMKEQRLQRDAQRRQSTQVSGKRSYEDDDSHADQHKKRSRPRAKYEDEIENHEHERESRRWR